MILGMMARRIAAEMNDPYAEYVVALLRMTGDDGDQSWPDLIGTTWQRNAGSETTGPFVDDEKKVFGTNMTRFVVAASVGVDSGEFIIPTTRQQALMMEDASFVIEGWFSPLNPVIASGFWWSSGVQNSTTGLLLGVTPTKLWWRSNVFTDMSVSVSIGSDPVHVAWVRDGTARRIYLSGVLVASDSNGAFDNDDSDTSRIGTVSSNCNYGYNGWIGPIRITKGSIRGYAGSTIDVPTGVFAL